MAEQVRDELLQLDSISQVDIVGARDYQIDVEIDEADAAEVRPVA